jgi:hypothetical protein
MAHVTRSRSGEQPRHTNPINPTGHPISERQQAKSQLQQRTHRMAPALTPEQDDVILVTMDSKTCPCTTVSPPLLCRRGHAYWKSRLLDFEAMQSARIAHTYLYRALYILSWSSTTCARQRKILLQRETLLRSEKLLKK